MSVTRRDFLMKSALGASSYMLMSQSFASVMGKTSKAGEPDVVIKLTASLKEFSVKSNNKTTFWHYHGTLIKGPKRALTQDSDSFLGPKIEVFTGERVKIIFENNLPEKSIVHWHGLDVSHGNDGHPHNAIGPGKSYEYDFEVENRAGLYWYHPHPHGRTGFQVYQGLAGLFVVRDQEELSLSLPSGEQELIYSLCDRSFDEQGQLDYRPSMMGAFGRDLFVNGKKGQRIKVKKGTYRVRLHNGCNARIFNLGLTSSKEFIHIGSDAGLLASPVNLKTFLFAPAERVDFLIDFTDQKVGEVVKLESLPLIQGRGNPSTLMEFEVEEESGVSYQAPQVLCQYDKIEASEAVNIENPKKFDLYMARGIGWTINGNGYSPDKYEPYEIIKHGDTEVWEFYNPTGMPHPMHIHGTSFQVLKRERGQFNGTLDYGWKDVVLVMPGDRVQVIKRFDTYKGTFIYHCHNLEHEDMSMMRNFKIV